MADFKLSHTAEEVDELLTRAKNAVLHTPQELTEEQKTQARENIGALHLEYSTESKTVYLTEADIIEDAFITAYSAVYGQQATADGWVCSDYIPLGFEPGMEITVRSCFAGNAGIGLYDASKKCLLAISGNTGSEYGVSDIALLQTLTIVPPDGAKYVRVSAMGTVSPNSDYTKPSDLFVSGYVTVCKADTVLCVKQTLTEEQKTQARENIGAVSPSEIMDKLVIEKKIIPEMTITEDRKIYANVAYPTHFGGAYHDANWFCTELVPCSGATKVTTFAGKDSDNNIHTGFVFYDSAGNPIDGYPFIYGNSADTYDAVYSVPEGAAFFRTSCKDEYKADFYVHVFYNYPIGDVIAEEMRKTESYNLLADKKVLIIGDSISADYYGEYKKWVTILIDSGFFSYSNVTNDSVHATGFVSSYSGDGTDRFLNRLQAIENPDDFDIVIIFGGINDFIRRDTHNIEFSQFTSAVDEFFEYLTDTFANARICVFRPLRNDSGEVQKQLEYSEYINTVAKSYCLPVLNLTEESGFYPWKQGFKNRWTFTGWSGGDGVTGDGTHPNEEWQETRLAPMIKSFLKSLI